MASATEIKLQPGFYRPAPQVPMVFLPDVGQVANFPRLALPASLHARRTADRLRQLQQVLRDDSHVRDPRREQALENVARSFGCLLESLSPIRQMLRALTLRTELPVHAYFGIVHGDLSPQQHACEALGVFCRLMDDLACAPMDVNDALAEIECVIAVLEKCLDPESKAADSPLWAELAGAEPRYQPRGDTLERWILVHQAYFLLNIYAASEIGAALAALEAGAKDKSTTHLNQATMFVRGFSATMMHSGALSSAYYQNVVRPTMQPPATPMHLTGSMQPEHAAYRASLKALLNALPENFSALARNNLALALARDALLEADLIDIERHVCLAHALVGDERSLVQHEQAPTNAVTALRVMRHARAQLYFPFMRYPDPAFAHLSAIHEDKECPVR